MTQHTVSEVEKTVKEPEHERRVFTFKATQLVWLFLGILEGLLGLRFILKLIAANPESPISVFIYGITNLFLFPFTGLTATPAYAGMVLETSTLIAMVVYGLLGWGLERLIWIIFYRPRGPITEKITTDKRSQ